MRYQCSACELEHDVNGPLPLRCSRARNRAQANVNLYKVRIKYNDGRKVKLDFLKVSEIAQTYADIDWSKVKSYKIIVRRDNA